MAAGETDVGTGTVLAYTGFTMELLSVSWGGISRQSIDTTHMQTTGARTKMPSDLYEAGEISVDVHFMTDEAPPITAPASSLTVTFPDDEDWGGSAFMTEFEFTDPLEDKMLASAVFAAAGTITF